MYFPYLRGKQFELIALRELAEQKLLNEHVIPIVEPLKLTTTLNKTIKKFIDNKIQLVIIINPMVGNFSKTLQMSNNEMKQEFYDLCESEYILKGVILNSGDLETTIESVKNPDRKLVTICLDREGVKRYQAAVLVAKYNIMHDISEIRRNVSRKRVVLDDKFNLQKRNSDYLEYPDEIFSSDHLYFDSEGYVGFADYSIIGSNYTEGGFAPYAVSIHIVYFDSDKTLKIKHYTSDSNEGYFDTAGKFGEAIRKLIEDKTLIYITTQGLEELRKLHREGKYPGLGTIKKLTVMHHIEIMAKYLEKENS